MDMAGNRGSSRRQQRNGKTEKDEKKVHFPTVRSGGFDETQVICYLWDLVKFMETENAVHSDRLGVEPETQRTDERAVLEKLEKQVRSRVRVEMRRYFLRRKRRSVKLVAGTLCMLLGIIVLFTCILGVDRVNGNSMYPYLNHGDWIIYSLVGKERKRDEVVVFEKNGENLVKRIAGLPGDTVEINASGKHVMVNGVLASETYVILPDQEADGDTETEEVMGPLQTVMDGQYLVLGDNRSVSIDSRDRNIGTVSGDEILGRVILILRAGE